MNQPRNEGTPTEGTSLGGGEIPTSRTGRRDPISVNENRSQSKGGRTVGTLTAVRVLPTGERALLVLPAVTADAPPLVREGIRRRQLVLMTDICPCGGRAVLPSREVRRAAAKGKQVARFAVRHEDDCPAIDDVLLERTRAWIAGGAA